MRLRSKFISACKACNCVINIGDKIEWTQGVGARHATLQQCEAAKKARVAAPRPTLDLKSITDLLLEAQRRGLKAPKLRVLAPDRKTEVRLSITTKGAAPGSIAVLVGGDFRGCIRPDGKIAHATLSQDTTLCDHLRGIAQEPREAAKQYGILMGRCSFCGKELTDEGSVEVGYGPICADRWGLPHTPKGTPVFAGVQP